MNPIPTLVNMDDLLARLRSAEESEQDLLESELRGAIADLEHTFLGPSWQSEDDQWRLPEKTLGWEVLGWCADYLNGFESDPSDPSPLMLTDEQARLILWWYAVDNNGNFVYRKGVIQRLKGWG